MAKRKTKLFAWLPQHRKLRFFLTFLLGGLGTVLLIWLAVPNNEPLKPPNEVSDSRSAAAAQGTEAKGEEIAELKESLKTKKEISGVEKYKKELFTLLSKHKKTIFNVMTFLFGGFGFTFFMRPIMPQKEPNGGEGIGEKELAEIYKERIAELKEGFQSEREKLELEKLLSEKQWKEKFRDLEGEIAGLRGSSVLPNDVLSSMRQELEKGNLETVQETILKGREERIEKAAAQKTMLGVESYILGSSYELQFKNEQALKAYKEALKFDAENRKYLNSLGLLCLKIANYGDALYFLSRLYNIAKGKRDDFYQAAALGNLGLVYADLGDYPKATQHYLQALEISRRIGDLRREGNALGNLGSAYLQLGDYPKAVEHHLKVLEISRKIGDQRGEGTLLGNLGVTYFKLEEHQKSYDYLTESLAIFKKILPANHHTVKYFEQWREEAGRRLQTFSPPEPEI